MIRGRYLSSRDDLSDVTAIRRRVFVEEQGFSRDAASDEYDQMAFYALVFDEAGVPSGTGRLAIENDRFTIDRVCVLREARGQGLGDLIMRMLIYRAQELCAASVWVNVPRDAIPFYTRYGFRSTGEVCAVQGAACEWLQAAGDELCADDACAHCKG